MLYMSDFFPYPWRVHASQILPTSSTPFSVGSPACPFLPSYWSLSTLFTQQVLLPYIVKQKYEEI